jgi:signal transduction histidine kinase
VAPPERVDLQVYLPEFLGVLASVLGRHIQSSVRVAPNTWPIAVDVNDLALALVNLALNARDALPVQGHLWLAARNAADDETQGLAAGRYVIITATDDGVGLEEGLADRAFEPFFTTKAAGHGSGLGLSQVQAFCARAGGSARLAGTPGLGSTATLVLPAMDVVQANR